MKEALVRVWMFITASLWMAGAVLVIVADEFAMANRIVFGIALALSLLLALAKRKEVASFLKKPRTMKAATVCIRVFLVLCVLGIANYIAVKRSVNFDLTASKLHTLSEQSKIAAKNVKEETTLTLFAQRGQWERYLSLLRQYENENRHIEIKAVDVEENPALARLNQIQEDGTLILETGGRKVKGSANSELEITNLLIKGMREKRLKIYYTAGHGELKPEEEGPAGASFLFETLKGSNYEVVPLDTLKSSEVPRDADAVLMLGPKLGLMDFETKTLRKYLERGGNVFALLGPNFEKKNLANLKELIKSRGVIHHNALVLDRLSAVQGANATIPVVNRYNEDHTATKSFSGKTLFPLSAALEPADKNKNIKYTALAKSSPFPASWAESAFEDLNSGKVFYNKGLDLEGPVALLAVTESNKDFGKLAVSSSSDFVANAYQNQSANFNLFLNTLSWLMDDEGIISLNRPALQDNLIVLSASQISLIFYFSILFQPFVFFGLAIWIFKRRANK